MSVELDRDSRPYVDFYSSKGISPVHQDVTDRRVHFERRTSLYRALGILPRLVRGARVLEIGPGSGHNALYTASLGPSLYTMVDGNPLGLSECRELLGTAYPEVTFAYVEGFVEDIPAAADYDLVLAEGMLSAQKDPPDMARRIGSHVAPDGVLVITCMDDLSFVGESTRRLIAQRIVPTTTDFDERLRALTVLFAPHLNTLAGMSRAHDEWVLDNILHPLPGALLPIDSAIESLAAAFDFYGSSPDFVTDWRWYKRLHSGERDDNGRAVQAYRENVLALLDCRVLPSQAGIATGEQARRLAGVIYRAATGIDFGEAVDWEQAIGAIDDLGAVVADTVPTAAESLRECRDVLRGTLDLARATSYASFFGRGQQYVSFTRRTAPAV